MLVSSGAVGTAMSLLKAQRPSELGALQAFAAIGQAELIHHYNQEFLRHGKRAAQVLLTIEDMDDRKRYLNLRNSISALFELNAVPIVNENDCVATDEIAVTFGDNDRLAANVALMLDADLLVVLSDVDSVYDRSPADPDAQPISFLPLIDQAVLQRASGAGPENGFSKGGMASKLNAARMVSLSGIPTLIAGGRSEDILLRLVSGDPVGTLIAAAKPATSSKKRWIRGALDITGHVIIDSGAVKALCDLGKSLLPIGVRAVSGTFARGDVISVLSPDGSEIARGISNFSSEEALMVAGCRTAEVLQVLKRATNEELIHRDNLVLV